MKRKGWKMGRTMLLCGFFLLLLPGLLLAQPYPTKPVNILVSFAPGGTMDISVRVLASGAEKNLGQPFIISNNGEGGGSVALGIVSKKRPDGYDLVACTSTGLVGTPQYRKVTYSLDDFIPIMHFGAPQTGLVVNSNSPWKTLKDLIDYAKENPGKVTYSIPGVGSTMHLGMEYVGMQAGIKWTYVTFSGGAPALTALLGGHISAQADSAEWLPHVKNGSLRLLATFGEKRMKEFPDVPTFRELGYDYANPTVFLFAAPKGTPAPIIKSLDDAFHKAMESPQFVQIMEKEAILITYRNSEDTKKHLENTYSLIGKMIKDFNLPTDLKK